MLQAIQITLNNLQFTSDFAGSSGPQGPQKPPKQT